MVTGMAKHAITALCVAATGGARVTDDLRAAAAATDVSLYATHRILALAAADVGTLARRRLRAVDPRQPGRRERGPAEHFEHPAARLPAAECPGQVVEPIAFHRWNPPRSSSHEWGPNRCRRAARA